MEAVTLDRDEWLAVARELSAAFQETAPPGLRSRIAALLDETPARWGGQACTLDLDGESAAVVWGIVRRGLPEDLELRPAQDQAITQAVQLLQEDRSAAFRVEHRTGGTAIVIARTSAADARQAELSQHAARLTAAGATGELVLVDEATGQDLAWRRLGTEIDPGIQPSQPDR